MYLHQIISSLSESEQNSVLYEKCQPYLKALKAYYMAQFNCSAIILMVVSVSNAAQYVRFCSASDFQDAVYSYLDVPFVEEN